MKRLTL